MHVHKYLFYKNILFFEINKLIQIIPSPNKPWMDIARFCHYGFERRKDFNLVIMVHSFLFLLTNNNPLDFVASWQLSCRRRRLLTTKVFQWQLSLPQPHGNFPLHFITILAPCPIIGSPNTRCACSQVFDYIWSWKVVWIGHLLLYVNLGMNFKFSMESYWVLWVLNKTKITTHIQS